MRDINTKPKHFRELVNEITEFLAIESLKDLRTVEIPASATQTTAYSARSDRGALFDEPFFGIIHPARNNF